MNKVIALIALSVLLAACNRTLPCDDCEEDETAVIDYDSGDPGLFVEVRCCCVFPGG